MPRLSDKHIAAIRAAAEDNDQSYGFGDVILLCDELQVRRRDGSDTDSASELCKRLEKRINDSERVDDADVLTLFYALQKRGYFQTLVPVPKDALHRVLSHLSRLGDHRINELVATRGMPRAEGTPPNPIDELSRALSAAHQESHS